MPSKGGRRETEVQGRQADTVVEAVLGGSATPTAGAPAEVMPEPPMLEDPRGGTPAWAQIYDRAVARHREERERIDREQLEAQRLWDEFLRQQCEAVPEGERSLVENEPLHRQLQQMARSAAAAEYERVNVIGDPNQTFGIEIEFDGADANQVARALYEAGLTSSPHQEGYHSRNRRPGMWSVERDATVAGEVVSPQHPAQGGRVEGAHVHRVAGYGRCRERRRPSRRRPLAPPTVAKGVVYAASDKRSTRRRAASCGSASSRATR